MAQTKRCISVVGGLLCSLLALGCTSSNEPVPFTRHFEEVRSIDLSEKVFINKKIQTLDVRENGDLLITDIGHVYLFDRNGQLKKDLDASPCHPGFRMRPISAHFRPDGKIFMINSGQGAWGFLFHEDGTCWRKAPDEFLPPKPLAVGTDGRLYGFYIRPGADSSRLKVITGKGQTLKTYKVPATKFSNVDMRIGDGGGMVYHKDRVYQGLPSRPTIHVYSRDGEVINSIHNPPSYYEPITADVPAHFSNAQEFVQAMGNVLEGKTYLHSLHLLRENTLLVQYKINRIEQDDEYGIDVLDVEGHRLSDGPVKVPLGRQIRQGKRGRVCRIVQPEPGEDGEVPNPHVEVYRFTQ